MTSQDLTMPADYMSRVRALYPGAVSIGSASGLRHQTLREIALMERRGEIVALRQFEKQWRGGTVEIPYVRLKTRWQMRKRLAVRVAGMTAVALVFLGAVSWLAWESRYVIGTVLGTALAILLAFWLAPHWTRGCPGMHCSGCRG